MAARWKATLISRWRFVFEFVYVIPYDLQKILYRRRYQIFIIIICHVRRIYFVFIIEHKQRRSGGDLWCEWNSVQIQCLCRWSHWLLHKLIKCYLSIFFPFFPSFFPDYRKVGCLRRPWYNCINVPSVHQAKRMFSIWKKKIFVVIHTNTYFIYAQYASR